MKIPNIFRLFARWCSTSGRGTGEGLKQDLEETPFLGKRLKHESEDIPFTGAVRDLPLAGGDVKQDHEDIPVAGEGVKHELEDTPVTGAVVKHEFGDIPLAGGGVKQDLADIPVAGEGVKHEFGDIPLAGGGVKQDLDDIPVAGEGVKHELEDAPVSGAVVKHEFGDIPLAGGGVKQDLDDIPVDGEGVKHEFEGTPFVPEKGFYQPSTEETWEAYQALFTLVEAQSQANLPGVVMCGVTDEVLSVLKCNNINAPQDKKAEIEKILNPIPQFVFNQMTATAKLITDYYYGQVVMFTPARDFYQPKSDTCTAYKLLLDLVNNQVSYKHPQIQQCILAHKVLEILNDEKIDKSKRREEIEYTLANKISDDTFDTILFIGELITDFNGGGKGSGPTTFGADTAKKEHLGENSIKRWKEMVEGFDYGGQIDVCGLDDSTDDDEPMNFLSDPTTDVDD